MTKDQLVVLALLGAAFIAGWLARGANEREATAPAANEAARDDRLAMDASSSDAAGDGPRAHAPEPLPVSHPGHADWTIEVVRRCLTAAIDQWIDDRDTVSPEGRRLLERLDEETRALEATARDGSGLVDADRITLRSALTTLHAARGLLERYERGLPLDGATSQVLSRSEDQLAALADGRSHGGGR